jgi:hypothetical protein
LKDNNPYIIGGLLGILGVIIVALLPSKDKKDV